MRYHCYVYPIYVRYVYSIYEGYIYSIYVYSIYVRVLHVYSNCAPGHYLPPPLVLWYFNKFYCPKSPVNRLTSFNLPSSFPLPSALSPLTFSLSSCFTFYCVFLLRSYQGYSINNRQQTFNSSYYGVNRDIEQQTILLVFKVLLFVLYIV